MINLQIYSYKEKKPAIGRTVYNLAERECFDSSYFLKKYAKVSLEEFDTGEGYELLLYVGEEPINLEDHWCYVDDIDRQLSPDIFFVDWEYYLTEKTAEMITLEDEGEYTKKLYRKGTESFVLSFRDDCLYMVKESKE